MGTHSGTIRARRSLLSRSSYRTSRAGLTGATGRTSLTATSSCTIFAHGSGGTRGSSDSLHRGWEAFECRRMQHLNKLVQVVHLNWNLQLGQEVQLCQRVQGNQLHPTMDDKKR